LEFQSWSIFPAVFSSTATRTLTHRKDVNVYAHETAAVFST